MLSRVFVVALSLSFGAPLAQAQPDQPQGDDSGQPRQDQGRRRGRRNGPTDAERQQWRERQERMRNATPEERRKMMLDGWMDMTTRGYELTADQQATVRKEMEAMDAERRAKMGAEADEYDKLRAQQFEMWAKLAEQGGNNDEQQGGPQAWRRMRENPEYQKIQQRIDELDQKYPFDMMASIQRIEKLIPEEQVKKAHARFEEQRAQWQQRQDQNQGNRRGNRRDRQRGQDRPGEASPPPPAGGADKPAADAGKAKADAERAAAEAAKRAAETPPPAAAPMHPWEKYVREFIARYELSEAQATSAQAVLKDVMKRAAQIEATYAKQIAEAEQIKDRAARETRLKELNKPMDQLFDELKRRLDTLLTAQQRAKKSPV